MSFLFRTMGAEEEKGEAEDLPADQLVPLLFGDKNVMQSVHKAASKHQRRTLKQVRVIHRARVVVLVVHRVCHATESLKGSPPLVREEVIRGSQDEGLVHINFLQLICRRRGCDLSISLNGILLGHLERKSSDER